MKVIDLINNNKTGKPLFTFELLPPVKGHSIEKLYKSIDPLMEFDPAYIGRREINQLLLEYCR